MSDFSRTSSFRNFAYTRDGYALSRRIHAMARHYMSGHIEKIEPNWHCVDFCFDGLDVASKKRLELPLADKNACQVEFDYRPEEVWLVGPKAGWTLITDRIFDMIPEPLMALVRMCDVLGNAQHRLDNPKHKIELIDGRTLIHFEHCASGVVRNIRGDTFDTEGLDTGGDYSDLTREQMLKEIKESRVGDFKISGVGYFPLPPWKGRSRNTPEEYAEARRLEWIEMEEEAAVERAKREAKEAAAYAALSPEERVAHDNARKRQNELNAILHAMRSNG